MSEPRVYRSLQLSAPLTEHIEWVFGRPTIPLGKISVTRLFVFLRGMRTAMMQFADELSMTEADINDYFSILNEFEEWLEHKYQVQSARGWLGLILLYATDERDGFERFRSEWMRFLSERHYADG